jgi:hypothetical protein
MRLRWRSVLAALCAVGLLLAPGASADFHEYAVESLSASLSSSQAGAHSDFVTFVKLKTQMVDGTLAQTRDLFAKLPPGLLGDLSKFPRCSAEDLNGGRCSISDQVGFIEAKLVGTGTSYWPLFNMVPPEGSDIAARLGFLGALYPVTMDIRIHPEEDYLASADIQGIASLIPLESAKTTIWGVPGSPIHNHERVNEWEENEPNPAGLPSPLPPVPFLSNPTQCTSPLEVSFSVDSYQLPGLFSSKAASMGALTGCEKISFTPQVTTAPTSSEAAAPTGINVDIKMPQDETPEGLATANLRDASVSLPEGMAISPGSADGLGACDAVQAAYDAHGPAHCPDSSQLGTVELDVVGLDHPLHGSVYLRNPEAGDLFRIWIVADELGVHVALPGEIHADPQTGRLTTTFTETPQVPTREVKLHLAGGPRAPLVNPATCGIHQTDWRLTPWTGNPAASGQSPMSIDTACDTGGFAPKLTAGATSAQAGAFAPFVTEITRNDGEQNIGSLNVTLPPGVLADLSGVPQCDPAAAVLGDCPAASRIGTVTAAVGAGPAPLWVPQPGKPPTAIYLTGPYKGAPFGLAVKVPGQAGPFDLGTVTVMVALSIDPLTAQVHAHSDPLPQILQGVPLSYRDLRVQIDRPGFTVNPTNCNPLSSTAAIVSNQGRAATVTDRFQASGCANLKFKPIFKASTSSKTSRTNGASLKVKLAYPKARFGTQANIAKVKVDLPRQLPSRLATLQQACPAEVFEANPASCPSNSRVGSARAHTPILPVPVEGPAYFVSYGGVKFPELIVVLQGDGVTVDLHGETFISPKNVTSSTFRTIPDVPVETFELNLPQGRYSALGANANLCTVRGGLKMPVIFTAQNGLVVKQTTKVGAAGCARSRHVKHKRHKRHKRKR